MARKGCLRERKRETGDPTTREKVKISPEVSRVSWFTSQGKGHEAHRKLAQMTSSPSLSTVAQVHRAPSQKEL
jgi:predicted NUDIX family NTP pyrophosphohydrolase